MTEPVQSEEKKPEGEKKTSEKVTQKGGDWKDSRISELTAEKNQYKEEREIEKNARMLYEEENKKLKEQLKGQNKKPVSKPQEGPTEEDYKRDVAATAAEISARNKFIEEMTKLDEKGKKDYEDWDEKVIEPLKKAIDGKKLRGLYNAVLTYDEPHELLYELAEDLNKTRELMNGNPVNVLKQLTRISDKLEKKREEKELEREIEKEEKKKDITTKSKLDGGGKSKMSVDLYDPNVKRDEWLKHRRETRRKSGRPRRF